MAVGEAHQLFRVFPKEFSPHIHAEKQGNLRSIIIVGSQNIDSARHRLKASAVIFQFEFHHLVQNIFCRFRLVNHQHEKLIHFNQIGYNLKRPLMPHDQRLIRIPVALLLQGSIVEPVGIGESVFFLHVRNGLHPIQRKKGGHPIGIDIRHMLRGFIAPEGLCHRFPLFVLPHRKLRADISGPHRDHIDFKFFQKLVILRKTVMLHQLPVYRSHRFKSGRHPIRILMQNRRAHALS